MSDREKQRKKEKKIKKKEKKEKKEKKQKKQKYHNQHPQQQKHQLKIEPYQRGQQISRQTSNQNLSQILAKRQDGPPEKTHISCRRCKQITFSLKSRTCFKCGYPKQTRPQHFPVTKEVQVMDLIHQGKLVHNSYDPFLIEIIVNDRMGKRERVKCYPNDKIGDFKKLVSAKIGTRPQKIRLQKANVIFKDHLSLSDYEIKDGMGLEMYYD